MDKNKFKDNPASKMFYWAFRCLFRADDAFSIEEFDKFYSEFENKSREAFRLIDFEKNLDTWYHIVHNAYRCARQDYVKPLAALIANKRLDNMMKQALLKYGFRKKDKGSYTFYLKEAPAPMIDIHYVNRELWDRSIRSRSRIDLCMWNSIDVRYRTKVIGFEPHMFGKKAMYYVPVFDKETQAQWDEEELKWQTEGIPCSELPEFLMCRSKFLSDIRLSSL